MGLQLNLCAGSAQDVMDAIHFFGAAVKGELGEYIKQLKGAGVNARLQLAQAVYALHVSLLIDMLVACEANLKVIML